MTLPKVTPQTASVARLGFTSGRGRLAADRGHPPVEELTSCRTSGRRVTMPDPRGKKSLQGVGVRRRSRPDGI